MKVDEYRQELNRRSVIGARGVESREQFVEMLDEFRTERRGIEPPAAACASIWHGCRIPDAVGQAVSQNEPADHADAKVLEEAKVVVDLGVPAGRAPALAPGRRAKTEVPSVVEPWIIHTDLHACGLLTDGRFHDSTF